VANTISLVVTVMLQYWVLKRHTHIDAGPVLKFCFSSAVMCVVVWLILQCSLGGVAEVVLSLVCGIVVYSLCVLKVGAVLPEDIDLMRSALSAFGRFGKAFEPLLDLAQRVIEL
jgi:hypothetical protein